MHVAAVYKSITRENTFHSCKFRCSLTWEKWRRILQLTFFILLTFAITLRLVCCQSNSVTCTADEVEQYQQCNLNPRCVDSLSSVFENRPSSGNVNDSILRVVCTEDCSGNLANWLENRCRDTGTFQATYVALLCMHTNSQGSNWTLLLLRLPAMAWCWSRNNGCIRSLPRYGRAAAMLWSMCHAPSEHHNSSVWAVVISQFTTIRILFEMLQIMVWSPVKLWISWGFSMIQRCGLFVVSVKQSFALLSPLISGKSRRRDVCFTPPFSHHYCGSHGNSHNWICLRTMYVLLGT